MNLVFSEVIQGTNHFSSLFCDGINICISFEIRHEIYTQSAFEVRSFIESMATHQDCCRFQVCPLVVNCYGFSFELLSDISQSFPTELCMIDQSRDQLPGICHQDIWRCTNALTYSIYTETTMNTRSIIVPLDTASCLLENIILYIMTTSHSAHIIDTTAKTNYPSTVLTSTLWSM